MNSDEVKSAEIFLGRLAKDVLPDTNYKFPQPFQSLESKIKLNAILAIYAYAVIFLLQSLISGSNNYFLIPLLGTSIILSYSKSQILFKNYAPDLIDMEINYTKFGLVQSFISTVLLLIINTIIIVFIGLLTNFTLSLFSITIFFMISSFFYIKFSDIELKSMGFGIGAHSLMSGLFQVSNNFRNIYSYNGIVSMKNVFYRLLYISIIGIAVYQNVPTSFLIILPLIYTYLVYPEEIKNASSVFMKIRGRINELTPGTVPDNIFEESDKPYPLAIPAKINPQRSRIRDASRIRDTARPVFANMNYSNDAKREIVNNSDKLNLNYREPKTLNNEDMSPYAAKTLHKIIQKVKQEGPLQKRGISHCVTCGSVLRDHSAQCAYCKINA